MINSGEHMIPARLLAVLWHFQGVISIFQRSLTVRTLQIEVGNTCKSSGKAGTLLDLWNLLWDVVIYQEVKKKGKERLKREFMCIISLFLPLILVRNSSLVSETVSKSDFITDIFFTVQFSLDDLTNFDYHSSSLKKKRKVVEWCNIRGLLKSLLRICPILAI